MGTPGEDISEKTFHRFLLRPTGQNWATFHATGTRDMGRKVEYLAFFWLLRWEVGCDNKEEEMGVGGQRDGGTEKQKICFPASLAVRLGHVTRPDQ